MKVKMKVKYRKTPQIIMKVKTNNSINYNNSKLLNITTIYMIFKYLDFRYFY